MLLHWTHFPNFQTNRKLITEQKGRGWPRENWEGILHEAGAHNTEHFTWSQCRHYHIRASSLYSSSDVAVIPTPLSTPLLRTPLAHFNSAFSQVPNRKCCNLCKWETVMPSGELQGYNIRLFCAISLALYQARSITVAKPGEMKNVFARCGLANGMISDVKFI